MCIDAANGNLKSVCFSLELSQNQFDGRIRELCPKLEQKPFKLFNFEKSRKLAEFPSTKLKEIKEMRYKGITVVQEGGEHVSPQTIVGEEEITESVPAVSQDRMISDQPNIPPETTNQPAIPQPVVIAAPPANGTQSSPTPRRNRSLNVTLNFHGTTKRISMPRSLPAKDAMTEIKGQLGISADSDIAIVYQQQGEERLLPKDSRLSIYHWGLRSMMALEILTMDEWREIEDQRTIETSANMQESLEEDGINQEVGPKIPSLTSINHLRRQTLQQMTTIQELIIGRSDIVKQAIEFYKDASISTCRLSVSFLGEDGVDINGLTREFITLFWKKFTESQMYGEKEVYVQSAPGSKYGSSEYEAVGRILAHGFILTGFLPTRI